MTPFAAWRRGVSSGVRLVGSVAFTAVSVVPRDWADSWLAAVVHKWSFEEDVRVLEARGGGWYDWCTFRGKMARCSATSSLGLRKALARAV